MSINILNDIQNSQNHVNTVLDRYFIAFSKKKSSLIQAMRYSTLLGGKRLRPFLVYKTGKLFGLKKISLDASAAAIECIHAYSLIYDDLPAMDNDIIRRGKPTCHIKFGESTAILAGSALQSLGFTILSEADMPNVSNQNRIKIIATLASSIGSDGLCFGQKLDLEKRNISNNNIKIETISKYKTGSLIRASVRIGALAAGKNSSKILDILDEYATYIGLAFQIQDDIIDFIENINLSSKEQITNKMLKNITYPILFGLKMSREKAEDLYYKSLYSLEKIKKLGYDTSTFVELSRYIIERNQ